MVAGVKNLLIGTGFFCAMAGAAHCASEETISFNAARFSDVREVQNSVRSMDVALFPGIKERLGEKQTFVYSLLASFSEFAGSDLSQETEAVQTYASVVRGGVQECLKDIESHGYQLNDDQLKGTLRDRLNTLLFYPEKIDFELIENPKLIEPLQEIVKNGTYTLFKIPEDSDPYYGVRIEIDDAVFEKLVETLAPYREETDDLGSSFDGRAHVTAIESIEFNKQRETLINAHEKFFETHSKTVGIKPVALEVGPPQAGKLSRVVAIVVEIEGLDEYRRSLGLGKLKFSPHISIFSQTVQPDPSLENTDIFDFTNRPDNELLSQLHDCLERFGKS